MGYYSDFTIETRTFCSAETMRRVCQRINETIDMSITPFSYFELNDNIRDEEEGCWEVKAWEMKWYDWEEDMGNISKEFPDIEFGVEKIGEDHDDWYYGLFKNGKSKLNQCSAPLREW